MAKRIILFFIAIFLCGFGIATTTQAGLGTTPISSLPYVFTFIFPVSFGATTFIINMIFILLQMLILREKFKKKDYLQIVVALFFGFFIDLGMHISGFFKTDIYFLRIIMLVAGSSILAAGVMLEVVADFLYVPGEGLVKAVSYKTNIAFGKVKTGFDVAQTLAAIILSLLFLRSIQGLREGTVISALLVGNFVGIYSGLRTKIKTRN